MVAFWAGHCALRAWGVRAMVSAPITSRLLVDGDLRSCLVMAEIPPAHTPGTCGKKGHRVANLFCGSIGTGMTVDGSRDITGLLAAWVDGDEDALSRLISLVYPELRRIARQHLGRRRDGYTLESAALANEAYLKLIRAGGIRCENRLHFLALCSQIIRRILVDYARGRMYAKRGGHAERVALDEVLLGAQAQGIEILALNEALESLAEIDARQARVVEAALLRRIER